MTEAAVGPHVPATGPVALSVIVCVRNGAARMHRQLDALVAQVWSEPWELLVVDNGSTDGTLDWLPAGSHHACGPGKTFQALRADGVANLQAFPSRREWQSWVA